MAEETRIKVSGAWKTIDDCKVKVSSAWKQVDSILVKVGGAWKTVWENWVVTLGNTSAFDISNVGAGYKVDADGNCYITTSGGSAWNQVNSSTDWIRPTSKAGSEFSVRFTEFSADATWQYLLGTGSLVDGTTWHLLNADRYVIGNSTNGLIESQCVLTVEISNDGGSTVLDSCSVTLSAEELP